MLLRPDTWKIIIFSEIRVIIEKITEIDRSKFEKIEFERVMCLTRIWASVVFNGGIVTFLDVIEARHLENHNLQ